jgi:hypothetical protein
VGNIFAFGGVILGFYQYVDYVALIHRMIDGSGTIWNEAVLYK